jgi:predicted ATPase/DNA-binding XRE family transcriptional regulator
MADNPGAELAEYVRTRRLRAGLTQEALAQRAGLTVDTVGALERGLRRRLYPHTARAIADALGLSDQERAELAGLAHGTPGVAGVPSPAPSPQAAAVGSPDTARPLHNLPAPLTRLIGRERELAQIQDRLTQARLLTLTGTGGVGKTRLALHLAADLVERFADGVWLVELAPVSDSGLVPQAVVAALGVHEEPGRPPLATLTEYLRPRRLLLVLDNCEHVLLACAALVQALLRADPGITVLATSREPLGITGEVAWRVPPLALPPNGQQAPGGRGGQRGGMDAGSAEGWDAGYSRAPDASADVLGRYAAVALFVERATAAQPRFALTDQNAATVTALCRRLDGIPLALELAAPRLRVLSLEQVVARLADRFRLLTGGSRAALPRQQTLQALINWSYDLLSEPERALFDRLAVFAGSFTLEAAEAVCSGEGLDLGDILDLLTRLVDKSLVLLDEAAGEEGRYRLLESLRQYGWQNLRMRGELERWRDRQRDWCLALAERALPELTGPHLAMWLERLEAEHDNLRAALGWALDAQAEPAAAGPEGAAVAGLRLAGALMRFWDRRGHFHEGRNWLNRVLAGAGGPPLVRARALYGAARLAYVQGDYAAAHTQVMESLALRRQAGDTRGVAESLTTLGAVAFGQGDYPTARALQQESLVLQRELGEQWGAANNLNSMGVIAMIQGDYPAARARHEEALALCRAVGDPYTIAGSLNNLGNVALHLQDYPTAAALHEEGLALGRRLGDRWGIARSLGYLGEIALRQGDFTGAQAYERESLGLGRRLGDRRMIARSLANLGQIALRQDGFAEAQIFYQESLDLAREMGDKRGMAQALAYLGEVLRARGDIAAARACYAESLRLGGEMGDRELAAPTLEGLAAACAVQEAPRWQHAARLLGAAAALRVAINAPLASGERATYDRTVAAARASLGEADFAAAWAAGAALALEQAIALALEVAAPV